MKSYFTVSDSTTQAPQALRRLRSLKDGETARISSIDADHDGLNRRRLLDLGFVPGTHVTRLGKGLFNGPTRFSIRGSVIALRDEQSAFVLMENLPAS
jgi:Fe2+ transport system protein FeoA